MFSKKWLQNHHQFLLHFKIHIDVLMLCGKFELISTKTFQVTGIFKKTIQFLKNTHAFFQKMAQKLPQFLLLFLIHIDVLMQYRKFELISTKIFQVTGILKNDPISEKYLVL